MNTQNITQVTNYLDEKNKQIEQANNLYIAANTRYEMLKKEYSANMEILKQSGINSIEELEQRIAKNESELMKQLQEIEELMPADLMEQYKDLTLDQLLNREEMAGMNLNQEF